MRRSAARRCRRDPVRSLIGAGPSGKRVIERAHESRQRVARQMVDACRETRPPVANRRHRMSAPIPLSSGARTLTV